MSRVKPLSTKSAKPIVRQADRLKKQTLKPARVVKKIRVTK